MQPPLAMARNCGTMVVIRNILLSLKTMMIVMMMVPLPVQGFVSSPQYSTSRSRIGSNSGALVSTKLLVNLYHRHDMNPRRQLRHPAVQQPWNGCSCPSQAAMTAAFLSKTQEFSSTVVDLQLGHQDRRNGDLAGAASHFRNAANLLESSLEATWIDIHQAQFEEASVLAEMGYVDESIALFSRIVNEEEHKTSEPVGEQQHLRKPQQQQRNDEKRLIARSKIRLANVLLDGRGEKKQSQAYYLDACVANPQSPMHVLAGCVLDSQGRRDEAMQYYQTAFDAAGSDPEAALFLLAHHSQSHDYKIDATSELSSLRSIVPDYALTSLEYMMDAAPYVLSLPSLHYFTYDMIQLSVDHVSSSLLTTSTTTTDDDHAATGSTEPPLFLEFGVYHGKTIRMVAARLAAQNDTSTIIHGFDTFQGIPEAWHATPQGSYSTHEALPDVPDHVQLHVGLFSDTLPSFLDTHPNRPIAWMNVDCDLYSSTKDIFDLVGSRIVSGTIIVFDEYMMNPNWKLDEYKAFQEAVAKHRWKYEYVAMSLVSQQAIVRIL